MANHLQFLQERFILCRINAGQLVRPVLLDKAANFVRESLAGLVGSDFADIFQCQRLFQFL